MTNELNHYYYTSLSPYTIQHSTIETEIPKILDRKRRNILESNTSNIRNPTISSQTLTNPILRTEISNSITSEADAYRPCGTTTTTTTTTTITTNTNTTTTLITSDNSSMNTRLPLAVKPLRQYQLKSENLHNSREYKCNNANSITTNSLSSSLPRISKTIQSSSSSKIHCKRQNSQNDIIMKSKCEPKTLIDGDDNNNNNNNITMKKFLHEINLNSFDNTTTSKKPIPTTLATNNIKNSTIDIKWESAKCNIKGELKDDMIKSHKQTNLIRPRRLTVACPTVNDWPKAMTGQRNIIRKKNTIENDSLKHKTIIRELPKKPWFTSSVDGPPIISQIHQTTTDNDNLSYQQRFSASTTELLASVAIQKPTVIKSGNSQILRIPTTPPLKPTRTYKEMLTDLMETEKSEYSSKSMIKSERKKISPIMDNSRMIVPREYCHISSSSRDHSSDSGFGTDFRKSSSDTIGSNPVVQISGKWLQSINLPCDSYCQINEDDLMLSENSLIRRRNSLVVRTQTGLRVKTIIDKLLNSHGREQRRALFSLKQIFQDDKDLVHEFVQNGGLECMIKLGRKADQNHQNYILRG
uniref:Formin_GBD_N domain-containing protein n=1 Tax=Loa loa TaxID=7209 RepID=A0A1I7VCA1_LOALO